MENIILAGPDTEYTDFMNLPSGIYKNSQYYKFVLGKTYFEAAICKKDGCTYYSNTTFGVAKGKNSFYKKVKTRDGFTINEKGKLSVWFGKNIFQLPRLDLVYNYFNLNWFNNKLNAYVTKSIAEKIFTGKITNNLDVCKAYIKAVRLNCSPKYFHDAICNSDSVYSINKHELLNMLSVAKDQNHLLENYINRNTGFLTSLNIHDLIQQAHILERKIDFNWSEKRLNEVHTEWTHELMEEELKTMGDKTADRIIPYAEFTHPHFKLLTTQKEIFLEGKTMHHCVYTNYWPSVLRGDYLVYHVSIDGVEATLGVGLYGDDVMFNQCYGAYNKNVSEIHHHCHSFINQLKTFALQKNLIKKEQYISL